MMGKLEVNSSEKVYHPCEVTASNKENVKATIAQLYVTTVECFFLILVGMLYMMPTIVVGALHNKKDDVMSLDDHTASWIGSILFICHPCGALTSGFMSERFGRRGAMMLVNIPFLGAWVLFYNASSVTGLLIATVLTGYGIGLCEAPVAAYLSESCEPRLRGIFNSCIVAACTMGNMIELYVGSIFEWRTSALLCVAVPIVSFLSFLTIPESPVWLITKGRTTDAQKALAWLRGFLEPPQVQKEFDEMVHYSKISAAFSCERINGDLEEKVPLDGERDGAENSAEPATGNWLKERYKELTNPKLYLPLRLVFISFFLTQCAGMMPFKSYLVEILNQFSFPFDTKWILVMTGAMSFLGSIAAVILVKLAGKRLLCIVCMIISTISIFCLGFYASFFTHTKSLILSWLITINLAIVNFAGNVGVINIPWMLLYEVYPIKGRSMACGMSAASNYLMSFFLTKTFLQTEHIIGLSGMFYLYGAISFVGCIYFCLHIPETEGKSLQKIETYFTPYHDRKEKFRMPRKNPSKA